VPATSQVNYGTTTAYGSSTTLDTTLVTSHSQTLSGLSSSTTYHYQVLAKDSAGNQVASADFVFTTQQACPCTIWPSSATPATAATNDPSAVELGVKFQSDTAGYINGIRFYKGSTNTGTHVGNLWSSTGSLLATATFTNETASGWQQVSFATPVQIQANTTYVASYHTNVGNYASNGAYFASSGVDSPPLHALSNATAGGNGVYVYSATSAFPNQTYNSTNYWVDIVFNTTIPPDFQIAASPSSQTVTAGGSATYTVTLTALNNYSAVVSLSATSQPAGLSPTFSPSTLTPTSAGATSTMTVPTSASTAPGSYTLTITGQGADGTIHSTTATIVVATTADFKIAASPSSLTVPRGSSGSYKVTLTAVNGYAASVNLSVSGLPRGVSATFAPATVTPSPSGASSTLTVTASANAQRGSKTLTITGQGADGTTHTTQVTLVIQ
jgi:hypothetical protein